ncbi:hypothetical protein SLEP1_g29083 [Rubroshorea leprosula]|uniref:Uncharacterized protein n=1 Tax=Rubroshorea leprosula TaxID=152421 RepID=A0AAV5JVR6_9ROSI|nr:hypothetical protein SLEP1_g29083 [Rubroshorea leprosula]
MQLKICFLIFPVSLLLLSLACSGDGATVGGWQPIKDLNDSHVKEIAKFAVSRVQQAVK